MLSLGSFPSQKIKLKNTRGLLVCLHRKTVQFSRWVFLCAVASGIEELIVIVTQRQFQRGEIYAASFDWFMSYLQRFAHLYPMIRMFYSIRHVTIFSGYYDYTKPAVHSHRDIFHTYGQQTQHYVTTYTKVVEDTCVVQRLYVKLHVTWFVLLKSECRSMWL